MKKILVLGLLLGSLFAAAKINVVTDLPTSKIYIDGVFAGVSSVQNYQVDPGERYVMVEYNGKKIFAKTYTLSEGEIKTIPTAHFVDFKTNVANRGAIDVEAARIRETRGDFGFGLQAGGNPYYGSIGGLSLKKWFGERFGVQAYGLINPEDGGTKYQGGARALIWIADKVAFDAPFSGYIYLGGGGDNLVTDDAEKNVKRAISHGGFGIEFSFFGVNGLYTTLELGVEKQFIQHIDYAEVKNGMLGSGGIHFYF